MKRIELLISGLLVPLDYLLMVAAILSAYTVRFGYLTGVRPATELIPFKEYLAFTFAVSALFVAFFALSGLYAVTGPRRIRFELSKIFFACSTGTMTIIAFIFFQRQLFASRFVVLAIWLFSIILIGAGRIIVRLCQRGLLRTGIGARNVVLIGGADRVTTFLKTEFAENPGYGYRIARVFSALDDAAKREIEQLQKRDDADELIVTDMAAGRSQLSDALAFAQSHHLAFRYSADPLATHARHIELGTIAGVPMVEVKGTRLDGWGKIYKRAFDIAVSLILGVIALPIIALAAVAIAIDSKGPLFFSRLDDGTPVQRVGESGKPFRYFKLRTMKPGTHLMRYDQLAHLDTRKEGPLVKIKNDPRITRVGAFLRKFSVDELPELFLVLTGSMSLVGPRPHLPEEVNKYQERHLRALTVKPGITGLAQVSGRADLDFDEENALDVYYIENWSPWLDLAILLKTPGAVFGRKGAY